MTTPRDLMLSAVDAEVSRNVDRGDLSLALAGAELIDLLAVQAVHLHGERIVPAYRPTIPDRMLDESASSLVREMPYESVTDWLWRRGRGLAAAYLSAAEADGLLVQESRRRSPFRSRHLAPADTPARRRAADRWASREPVLTALATVAGIEEASPDVSADGTDEGAETVLVAVDDAVTELRFVRQRREIEQAAFDNVWRGGIG